MAGNNKPGLGETLWRNVSGIIAPLSFLCITIIALSFIAREQEFLSSDNWANIVQSTAVVAILACGETAVAMMKLARSPRPTLVASRTTTTLGGGPTRRLK